MSTFLLIPLVIIAWCMVPVAIAIMLLSFGFLSALRDKTKEIIDSTPPTDVLKDVVKETKTSVSQDIAEQINNRDNHL